MDVLRAVLALNGVLVVFFTSATGFALYSVLVKHQEPHDWHLLHAGGTARGILLLGLAGTVHLAALPLPMMALAALLIVVFVWASTLAMLLRALSGEAGFQFSGSAANRAAFLLYALGAVALFPGLALLAWGFWQAL